MITITDEATFEAALASAADPSLHKLLAARLKLYRAGCLLDLATLVVLERGDTAADVELEAGLNPLISPLDGARYPSREFQAYWDYLAFGAGWYEWICCAGDAGYATILLAPEQPDVAPELLDMFRAYVGEGARRG